MCFKAMSTCTQLQKAAWSEKCSESNAVDAQGRFVADVQKALQFHVLKQALPIHVLTVYCSSFGPPSVLLDSLLHEA